jgi:hypothetical protein
MLANFRIIAMSAIGTKRTCESDQSMSAFGITADITQRLLVPKIIIRR